MKGGAAGPPAALFLVTLPWAPASFFLASNPREFLSGRDLGPIRRACSRGRHWCTLHGMVHPTGSTHPGHRPWVCMVAASCKGQCCRSSMYGRGRAWEQTGQAGCTGGDLGIWLDCIWLDCIVARPILCLHPMPLFAHPTGHSLAGLKANREVI